MTGSETPLALVTGGAQRIGAAIVRDLAAHGFAVAIHANSSTEQAIKLASEIDAEGGSAGVVSADLTDAAAVRALIGEAGAHFGRPVQLLVNNASRFHDDGIGSIDDATWNAHFEVHVRAPVLLAEAMAAQIKPGTEGLIVNMIDQRVWRPNPRFLSYTLSKSTLWTATQTLAQALAPDIRVNAIGPGPTLRNARQAATDFAAQAAAVPLKRGPELHEFGATIRYLWQARSITGQMIALDGGQHLAWETPDATRPE